MATRRSTGTGSASSPSAIPAIGVDVPELQQARSLWVQNRFDESLELFERAVRKYPQNLLALVDASRALGARFEIQRAEELLDRVMAMASRNARVWHLAGQSYRIIFRPEKALTCLEQAVALSRNLPDAHLELAVLHERRHRLAEASACLEECLRLQPDYLEAQLFQARLLRRRKEEASSTALFRRLAENEGAHPMIRAQAWAEIAQGCDRAGDYAGAMSSLLRGKQLLREHEEPFLRESRSILELVRTIAEAVTADDFRRWAEAAKEWEPRRLALLTSFPRSGTTLLEQILDSHPGLVSSDEREAFARDIFPAMWMTPATPRPTLAALDQMPRERWGRQRDRYLRYMEAALNESIDDRVHLDKNPPLTPLLPAMLRLFPEMKLLIALRDPRDVVLSCFMQYLPLNTNSVWYLSLERAAERFTVDLGMWLRLRSLLPGAWLEVRYEDTVRHLEREARRALDFLGLPWDPRVLEYRSHVQNKAVASPTYEAVAQPLYTRAIGRWQHYAEYFGDGLARLEPLVKELGYG
jgi:tetratricopeptide (TPR) repeat protein